MKSRTPTLNRLAEKYQDEGPENMPIYELHALGLSGEAVMLDYYAERLAIAAVEQDYALYLDTKQKIKRLGERLFGNIGAPAKPFNQGGE